MLNPINCKYIPTYKCMIIKNSDHNFSKIFLRPHWLIYVTGNMIIRGVAPLDKQGQCSNRILSLTLILSHLINDKHVYTESICFVVTKNKVFVAILFWLIKINSDINIAICFVVTPKQGVCGDLVLTNQYQY